MNSPTDAQSSTLSDAQSVHSLCGFDGAIGADSLIVKCTTKSGTVSQGRSKNEGHYARKAKSRGRLTESRGRARASMRYTKTICIAQVFRGVDGLVRAIYKQ